MLNQPTNVYPSTLSGNGTIDATKDLYVSWRVSGDSPLSGYEIKIYQNDTNSTLKYDTGTISLATPFWGISASGEVQYFTANVITASTIADAGIVNGYANGYKLEITQWWDKNDTSKYIVQTSPSAFITRATPTLSIAIPTIGTVPSRTYTFSATYSQAQGDGIKWVQWVLKNYDTGELIKDTGPIFGTGLLSFTYDGFFVDERYTLTCTVETENGVGVSQTKQLDCRYDTLEASGLIDVSCGKHNIKIDWLNLTTYSATTTGTVSGGKLVLGSGQTATWPTSAQTMSFSSPFSLFYRTTFTGVFEEDDITLLSATLGGKALAIQLADDGFYCVYDGEQYFGVDADAQWRVQTGDTYTVVLTQENMWLRWDTGVNGLYPGTSLYPATTLYPRAPEDFVWTGPGLAPKPIPSGTITGIKLYENQTCDYLALYNGTASAEMINVFMNTKGYEPTFTSDYYFLSDFSKNAGGIGTTAAFTGTAQIYRQENDGSSLTRIATLTNGETSLRDYSAKSQNEYKYYVALSTSNQEYAPYSSAAVTPLFWDWELIECELKNGEYHVIDTFPVTANITTGAISNNTSPQVIQTFTKYPNYQHSPSNYKSGTLTAYIGTISNNQYTDSTELADRFFNLATSTNPKFLKNRKGDIWMVELNQAVQMQTGDNYRLQPLVVTLGWVEVGDASEASVICVPSDSYWKKAK